MVQYRNAYFVQVHFKHTTQYNLMCLKCTPFGMYSLGTQLILHEMYLSLRCRIKVHLKCTYEGKCTSHVYLRYT